MNVATSRDGTEIAYDRSGDGPPLVIVAGAFCDRNSKKSLSAELSGDYTVYEYDRRGRGDSGAGDERSVQREVQDLAAVMAAAGDLAFVFGDSSGGALALEAAAAGVPVRKVAVFEVPYAAGPTSEFADRLDALVSDGRSSEAAEEFLKLMGAPAQAIAGMKAGPHWAHMEALAPTLSHDVRLCNEGDVPHERFATINAPVLALSGSQNPWAQDAADAIAAAIPEACTRILKRQGHAVEDRALAPVIREFFV